MSVYKCFNCNKIIKEENIKKKVRCTHCNSKILYKPRTVSTTIKAI